MKLVAMMVGALGVANLIAGHLGVGLALIAVCAATYPMARR